MHQSQRTNAGYEGYVPWSLATTTEPRAWARFWRQWILQTRAEQLSSSTCFFYYQTNTSPTTRRPCLLTK